MKISKIMKLCLSAMLLASILVSIFSGIGTLRLEDVPLDKIEESGEEEDFTPDEFTLGDIVDTSKAEYTYEELESDLFELQSKYPNLLRVASAGKSLDGREIYYADLGDPEAERSVMINAGIHGREYLTPLLLMKQLEYHLENYEKRDQTRKSFAEVFSGVLIRIVPMINPDGITISQSGLSGIRSFVLKEKIESIYLSDRSKYESYKKYADIDEYLKYWKANARGVDLNRNFGIDYWSDMKTGIPQPSSQKYKGESPNSEPETQALIALTQSMKGLCASVSIHSQGEIIYWDCGQQGEVREATYKLCRAISEINGYEPFLTFETPDATYNDWCALELGVPSVNIETGVDKCPLPIGQFDTIWNQNLELWKTVIKLYK